MEDSARGEDSSLAFPSFTLNGSSLPVPLADTTQQQPVLNAIPRLHLSPRRVSRRHPRPSTAPTNDEKADILPSIPSGLPVNETRPSTASSTGSVSNIGFQAFSDNQLSGASAGGEMEGNDSYVPLVSLRDDISSPDLGILPSPFEPIATDEALQNNVPLDRRMETTESDYDWATFISAYASGRWDPHRTPNPPRSFFVSPTHHALSEESRATASTVIFSKSFDNTVDSAEPLPTHAGLSLPSDLGYSPLTTVNENENSLIPQLQPQVQTDAATTLSATAFYSSTPTTSNLAIKLPPPSHRLRNSFADLRSTTSGTSTLSLDPIPHAGPSSSPDITTTAATMRWAAARVNLAPLALPSPEHELTDPMRGVMAAIPGAHSQETFFSNEPSTPGGTRKPRLASFWQGTQDVEEGANQNRNRLSTIEGSPSGSPREEDRFIQHGVPPASAPLVHVSETQAGDYFGHVDAEESAVIALREMASPITRRITDPPLDSGSMSVPALPRRVCLTRQTSAPLPGSSTMEHRSSGGLNRSENAISVRSGRAMKEERMFAELGYLAPPNPPDELERRRALYKFNIWNTGPDLNFDRIAHLAKLVFNTKGVFISLIDGNEQWFKSEWGMKNPTLARVHSFCAHTILQRGDEPMVVLDTHLDWRFVKNPLVTGAPNVRFYAGAPLRTQDGFNIGSLTVVDDSPRRDFTPRQRHTLKEFAEIVMREMELWRDKIQLRIRDRIQNSMEQFSRECLEIDTEAQAQNKEVRPHLIVGASMDKVYDRAAKLVKRTLDVEGVIVMDVSHCEVLETMSAEGSVSIVMHHGDPGRDTTTRSLSSEEYGKLNAFFVKYPDGKISEGIVPPSFRSFLPTHIQYALTVPIFNIDKRPFALLCAYNVSSHTKRFLEGHELSYLRAIGVIILSAVLKRRMILADKAKSLFISNISHELRTPLHGILAAAELLSGTPLNHSQRSFLQTVQACGTSLVETVNHVLDFTKLSGNSKSGGVDNVIVANKVDLMSLVEEAVDGCWIGHSARTSVLRHSEIGSVYSPPTQDGQHTIVTPPPEDHVETVVDIGQRKGGWNIICERGGLRRVLMNLFGNSLKFTTSGYVHVILRELPRTEDTDTPPNKIKVELSVLDTGKGISQNFLKNQLFHPFSQENPLQTGTGLGLAIVNSIVQSESVSGKVDVWSEEGVGTEIKVHFHAEVPEETHDTSSAKGMRRLDDSPSPPTISLVGFNHKDRGVRLFHSVLSTYLISWWGFEILPASAEYGDIIIVNEDPSIIVSATERRDISHPFVILSSYRGNPQIMAIASQYERVGGFCRILYKPGGPSRIRAVLKLCLHALKIAQRSQVASPNLSTESRTRETNGAEYFDDHDSDPSGVPGSSMPRRNSDIADTCYRTPPRPSMSPRAATVHPSSSWRLPTSTPERDETDSNDEYSIEKNSADSTISVGSGGTLLRSSVGTIDSKERSNFRVLVVEDNGILRSLLAKWLTNKGIEFRDAADGRDGVSVYESEGPFDVVLLDLSMPVLDGVGATEEIRQIESRRAETSNQMSSRQKPGARILALTGMSSLEDKRRAFEAGVDGYLVKPVAFKTLDDMFLKLGIS